MKAKNLLKKAFLLLALVGGASSAWASTIGLTQTVTDNGDTHTVGAASYTGTDHVTVTKSIGSDCGDGYTGRTIKVGDPTVEYSATKAFRKTINGSDFSDAQYVGYTMAVASGYKVSLANLNAEFWSSDATMTWKVVVLNPSGTQIYASNTAQNNSNNKGSITVASPTGLTDLKAGTYTIKLMMHQPGSSKYFVVPNFTFDATVEEDSSPTCTITANVADGQSSMGSIDKAGENVVSEGGSLALTATANEGYCFINWTKGGVEYATTASITLENITADATYVANFAQATRVVYPNTYAGTFGKMGTNYSPANGVNEKWADKDDHFTIPSYMHKYFYREGYRFNNWQVVDDGTSNCYDSGDEVTILAAAISDHQATISPNFVATTKTVADALVATDVTWSFDKNDMVFVDWQCNDENKYEYYTVTATIAGEVIDVPMKITKGKVANYTRTDDIAQTNQNTKFTIPAVKGMIVTIPNANKAFTGTTVAGSTDYVKSDDEKTLTYTYTGDASTIDIVIGEDNQYLKSIKVTYPKATVSGTITHAGWASFSSSYPLDLSTISGGTAYYASASDGSSVTLTETTAKVPANTGLMIKGEPNAEFTIATTSDETTAIDGNLLKGQTTTGTVTASGAGTYHYVFGYVTETPTTYGFYNLNSATSVDAGKAYLEITSGAQGARSLRISLGDITDIEQIDNGNIEGSLPVKRIVNGKLVIEKNGQMFNANGQLIK